MIKKNLVLGVLLSATAMPVFASSGLYASIQGGMGGMDTEKVSVDNMPYNSYELRKGTAWRPSIGYLFDIGNGANLGVELGYANYPNNKYGLVNGASQTFKGRYVDLLAVGKLHFNNTENGFYGLLKAGTAYMSQEFDGSNLFGTRVENDTYGTAPEVGLGLGYDFDQPVGVDLTYNRVFGNTATPQDAMALKHQLASVTTLMLGVTIHFPAS